MEWILLIISGFIALFGLKTEYRYIGIVLFVEFLAMTGYQKIMLDPAIVWYPIESTAYFFVIKSIIQALLFMIYMRLDSKWLSGLSLVIIGYLWYTACLALYGVDNLSYVETMTKISISQLMIGFVGVLHGYRYLLDNPRHRHNHRHHSGA